jgi:hypothetical protein
MNTDIACTSKKVTVDRRGAVTEIAEIVLKIFRALTFNADAVLKSKDWPYLWPK